MQLLNQALFVRLMGYFGHLGLPLADTWDSRVHVGLPHGTLGDMWDYHMGLQGICGTTTYDCRGHVELQHGTVWDSWGHVGLPHGTLGDMWDYHMGLQGICGTATYDCRGHVGHQPGT